MNALYLASASPRRQALLKQLGITFSVLNTDIDETPHHNELPENYVQRLAIAKAKGALTQLPDQQKQTACILAADTTVSINNEILGKPQSQQQAISMLAELSDKTHKVFTAITLYYQNQFINQVITTEVTMRAISEEEAIAYWQTGEPKDKAGGYAIQGLAAMFIEKIEGDYYSVVGLPIFATTQLLKQVGIYPLNKQ